jgi:hypothetical protein
MATRPERPASTTSAARPPPIVRRRAERGGGWDRKVGRGRTRRTGGRRVASGPSATASRATRPPPRSTPEDRHWRQAGRYKQETVLCQSRPRLQRGGARAPDPRPCRAGRLAARAGCRGQGVAGLARDGSHTRPQARRPRGCRPGAGRRGCARRPTRSGCSARGRRRSGFSQAVDAFGSSAGSSSGALAPSRSASTRRPAASCARTRDRGCGSSNLGDSAERASPALVLVGVAVPVLDPRPELQRETLERLVRRGRAFPLRFRQIACRSHVGLELTKRASRLRGAPALG